MKQFAELNNYYVRINPAEEQMTGLSGIGLDNFNCIKPNYGFQQRPNPTVHFVLSGKGTYKLNGNIYNISEKMMFYTPANVPLCYYPDESSPWTYVWFVFGGDTLHKFIPLLGLSDNLPCKSMCNFEEVQKILNDFYLKCINKPTQKVFYGVSAFMEIIACEGKSIESQTSQKTVYVRNIKKLIQENYASPDFTIHTLCDMMHLSHSYVCRIFSISENCTVASYMEKVRLEHAAQLLSNSEYSVSRIASMVGYNDPLHFMKRFKMRYGITALSYRKSKLL